LFPNSADDNFVVHRIDEHSADVTEGSGGIWERLTYDWSDPHEIVMTTTDSNVWGGASGHVYVIATNADGTTSVDATVTREGKNVKGRVIGLLLGTVGKSALTSAFRHTIAEIEKRNATKPST